MRARYADEGCVIAVAHNRNDVVETVLFNMARGTGMGGIKGIAPVRDHIVRPLLGSDRNILTGRGSDTVRMPPTMRMITPGTR